MFSVFEIRAFEHDAKNSINYVETTCDWQSTC